MQDTALAFDKLHEVSVSPFLHFVGVLLNGIPASKLLATDQLVTHRLAREDITHSWS